MSQKYKSSHRCYLIDHHSPQPPIVPLGNMNIHEYDQFFETAHIDSLMVYCKDHWGVTYYDSQVPGAQKHRGVEGDWIRTVRDKASEKNIEFVAYYCIEYDEGSARRFPEWRVRKADGTPLIRDDLFAKWSLVCYQTGYREFALSQLEEIVQNYHPDSLFLDIFGASLCYCDNCRRKFRKMYAYDLPESDEEIAFHKKDILQFLDRNAEEFLLELKARLKKIDPEIAITVNFACHYPAHIRKELDYQYSEPLLRDNWYSSIYARDTAVGQRPILAPGEASTVYNYDHPAQYICDLSSIAAAGCRVGMYSGSQHIDGTLEHEEAVRLGAVFQELEKMEPFFTDTRRPVKGIGIVQSDLSKEVGPDPLQADAILRMKRKSPHTRAVLGAMIACEQAKMPYSVLPENSIDADMLKDYDLILLPEVYVVKPELAKALESYVKNGGKVIASARTGSLDETGQPLQDPAISAITGLTYIKEHTEYAQNQWSAYLKNCSDHTFTGLLGVTTPPVSEFFIETTPVSAAKLVEFVLPAVACSPTEWINWWSPPPGASSSIPAVTLNQLEKGQVMYLAFDYFTMSADETYRDSGDFFRDLLNILKIQPVLRNETATPEILRTAFFEEPDHYQIHQLSTAPNRFHGEACPLSGGKIVSRVPVSGARLAYPKKQELTVEKTGDTWEIVLPDLTLQQLIILDKA